MGAPDNNDNNAPKNSVFVDEIEDKRMKKTLLIDIITKECASSSHDILKKIYAAVFSSNNDGSKLEATILSGGYTNYSYKVYVDKHPNLCIFAKLCFEYALWNPDKSAHYDLQRTVNEYEIMLASHKKTPNSVVLPLAVLDTKQNDQNMKVLITEWSVADEQFCNQFIDGSVDSRIAPQLANTLAELHLIADFDPNFNENVKPCMQSMLDNTMKPPAVEASRKTTNPKDRTETYCSSLGEELVTKIMDACISNYHQRDCLIHSDSHVFNTLVETKPSIEHLEQFGPNGTVVLCDWEMSMAGPMGRDVGLALSFPIACMVGHALSGNMDANESILAHINSLIDNYLSRMEEAGGKTQDEMAGILKNIAGWCGWFQYLVFYVMGVQDTYPGNEDPAIKSRVMDSSGILGLKLMRVAYDDDCVPASANVNEIRGVIGSLIEEEVTRAQSAFASGSSKRKPRKSSILRASNRRLSDTEMLYVAAESVRRLSIAAGDTAPPVRENTPYPVNMKVASSTTWNEEDNVSESGSKLMQ